MFTRIVLGFVLGAVAVLVAHQPIVFGLAKAGLLPPTTEVYSMAAQANAPAAVAAAFQKLGLAGWPRLFNQMFWGGLWGIGFALAYGALPGRSWFVKGIVLALIMIVVANWIVIPALTGGAMFAGMDVNRMWRGAAINSGFCLMLALLYGIARRGD